MRDRLSKTLFAAAALPAVLRAWLRLARLARLNRRGRRGRLDQRYGLEEIAERMSRVRPWRLAWLSNPGYLEACAHRFAGVLPRGRFGPCLERSLLLLDLWSRSGLRPRVHLGAATSGDGQHSFHAWVTVPAGENPPVTVETQKPAHTEIWSYSRLG